MKALLVLAGITLCSNLTAQNYSTGHASIVLRDSQRGNRKVPVEIFYPERRGGKSVGKDGSGNERFPVVCFAHAYLMPAEAYVNIQEMLVPEGMILVFPQSSRGLFPSHQRYAEDIAFALNEAQKMGEDPSSVLYGITDTVRCLIGHSLGGGAVFLAANMLSGLSAIVALAPLNTHPSAIQAASSVVVPSLVIAGSDDCITPPEKHQLPIYDFLASDEKAYILITGANHCQMASENSACSTGETMLGCRAGISRDKQHEILKRYLIPWLRFYLKGDQEAGMEFDHLLSTDESVGFKRMHNIGSQDQ
jgi:predicted dienelactone hydrolase